MAKRRPPRLPIGMANHLSKLWQVSRSLRHSVEAVRYEVERTICAYHQAGWTDASIAYALGLSPATVYKYRHYCCGGRITHTLSVKVTPRKRKSNKQQNVHVLLLEQEMLGVFGSRKAAEAAGKQVAGEVLDYKIITAPILTTAHKPQG